MRRGILPCLGATISDIHFFTLPLKPIQVTPSVRQVRRRVAGSVVTSVDRLGKRILLELDARQILVFEPRMTGMLSVENVPSQEHLRVRIDLAGGDLDKILEALQQVGGTPEKILVTHAHLDHIGAVAEPADKLDLPIEGLPLLPQAAVGSRRDPLRCRSRPPRRWVRPHPC